MEETTKTKKQRPTVAQVREMEEVISRQVQELNAWRDKYRALVDECATLRCSNEHMEKEMKRRGDKESETIVDLREKVLELKLENKLLKDRGLIARIFNRDV